MKKYLIISIILFVMMFLVSCEDRFSLKQTLYIDSIGIDYNIEENLYTLYYHISTSSNLLPAELGSTNTDNSYSIGKASASTVYEAIQKIASSVTRYISLDHIQSVIFSYSFLTLENLEKFVDDVKTYPIINTNFYCYTTANKIEEIFSIENPEYISSFFSLITSNDFSTNYNLLYFTELARAVYEENQIIKLINIKSTKDIWQNQDKEITSLISNGDYYLRKDGKSLFIDNDEYKGLIITNHDYATNIIYDEKTFTIYNQKIKIIEKNNVFTIKIRGDVYISNISTKNYGETIEKFNKYIEEEMNKLTNYSKVNNFDIFNLQDTLYRKKLDYNNFNYQDATIDFDIKYKMLN